MVTFDYSEAMSRFDGPRFPSPAHWERGGRAADGERADFAHSLFDFCQNLTKAEISSTIPSNQSTE